MSSHHPQGKLTISSNAPQDTLKSNQQEHLDYTNENEEVDPMTIWAERGKHVVILTAAGKPVWTRWRSRGGIGSSSSSSNSSTSRNSNNTKHKRFNSRNSTAVGEMQNDTDEINNNNTNTNTNTSSSSSDTDLLLDDATLSRLTSLTQAVLARASDMHDTLTSLVAGPVHIVFSSRGPLHFFAATRTGETEHQLQQLLRALHAHLLFALTVKLHTRLQDRPGADIRPLLSGSETPLQTLVRVSNRSPALWLDAFPILALSSSLRSKINATLSTAGAMMMMNNNNGGSNYTATANSNSNNATSGDGSTVYAILTAGYSIVGWAQTNRNKEHGLRPLDATLLTSFVCCTAALRSADAWTPICLPGLSDSFYVHAYIACLGGGQVDTSSYSISNRSNINNRINTTSSSATDSGMMMTTTARSRRHHPEEVTSPVLSFPHLVGSVYPAPPEQVQHPQSAASTAMRNEYSANDPSQNFTVNELESSSSVQAQIAVDSDSRGANNSISSTAPASYSSSSFSGSSSFNAAFSANTNTSNKTPVPPVPITLLMHPQSTFVSWAPASSSSSSSSAAAAMLAPTISRPRLTVTSPLALSTEQQRSVHQQHPLQQQLQQQGDAGSISLSTATITISTATGAAGHLAPTSVMSTVTTDRSGYGEEAEEDNTNNSPSRVATGSAATPIELFEQTDSQKIEEEAAVKDNNTHTIASSSSSSTTTTTLFAIDQAPTITSLVGALDTSEEVSARVIEVDADLPTTTSIPTTTTTTTTTAADFDGDHFENDKNSGAIGVDTDIMTTKSNRRHTNGHEEVSTSPTKSSGSTPHKNGEATSSSSTVKDTSSTSNREFVALTPTPTDTSAPNSSSTEAPQLHANVHPSPLPLPSLPLPSLPLPSLPRPPPPPPSPWSPPPPYHPDRDSSPPIFLTIVTTGTTPAHLEAISNRRTAISRALQECGALAAISKAISSTTTTTTTNTSKANSASFSMRTSTTTGGGSFVTGDSLASSYGIKGLVHFIYIWKPLRQYSVASWPSYLSGGRTVISTTSSGSGSSTTGSGTVGTNSNPSTTTAEEDDNNESAMLFAASAHKRRKALLRAYARMYSKVTMATPALRHAVSSYSSYGFEVNNNNNNNIGMQHQPRNSLDASTISLSASSSISSSVSSSAILITSVSAIQTKNAIVLAAYDATILPEDIAPSNEALAKILKRDHDRMFVLSPGSL